MKIAIGTTSSQKIGYLEEVLTELELEFCLIPFEVSSEISNQPLSSKETRKGSINRAKNALAKSTDCDFAIGIEVGYQSNKNGKYHMLCWATVIDPNGKKVSSKSHQLLLPEFYQLILKENRYIYDFIDQFLKENPDPPMKHIALAIKTRKPFIQTAIKTAILNYSIKS